MTFPSLLVAAPIAAVAAAGHAAPDVAGPIEPERTYCRINGPVPVHIELEPKLEPSTQDDDQEDAAAPALTIALIRPDGAIVAEAAAEPGEADLAELFPALWTRPPAEAELLYAQLIEGEERRGPALVLQPLLTPSYPAGATTDQEGRIRPRASIDRSGRPSFLEPDAGQVVYSGLRLWVDCHVVLETSAGPIELIMRPDEAPNTVWHFLSLVEGGLYTDVPFHRIVPDSSGHPFVIQTGDPSGTGAGGVGFYADLERSGLQHGYGVVSMARAADPNSNGSQFFISLSREATRHLDGAYTTFAQVAGGAEAIARIAATPVGDDSRPIGEPPRVVRAVTEPAPARGAGPAALTRTDAERSER